MSDRNNQRVLNRTGARELTQAEIGTVTGGSFVFHLTAPFIMPDIGVDF